MVLKWLPLPGCLGAVFSTSGDNMVGARDPIWASGQSNSLAGRTLVLHGSDLGLIPVNL